MAVLQCLCGRATDPFEFQFEAIIKRKYNHCEVTADIVRERARLHPDASYAIAVVGYTVVAVLEMQRVLTDTPSYPVTLRITQLVVFGSVSQYAPAIADRLIRVALRSTPTQRLQIYTPLPSQLMEITLSNRFDCHGTLHYSSKPAEGMFLSHSLHLPPPCPAEVEALSTRKPCTRPGCDNLATIGCAGVCISPLCIHPVSSASVTVT